MSNQSNRRNITDIVREFALAQQQSRAEAASINNWYQPRRNQAMMELERLENAYNERMAEHSVEWAQRLSNFMIAQGGDDAAIAKYSGSKAEGIRENSRERSSSEFEQEMVQEEAHQERGNTYTTAFSSLLRMAKPTENAKYSGSKAEGIRENSRERSSSEFGSRPAQAPYTPSVEALPIPRLERQTNVQYVPANLIEEAIPLPDLWDPEFLNGSVGSQVLAPVAAERVVAIVSDDECSDAEEEEDYAMDIC